MYARTGILIVCCVLLVAACSSVESDWSAAEKENTVAAYQAFLWKHLNGPYADQAWVRLGLLLDDQDWQSAQLAHTAEGYRHYLHEHPNGNHAMAARDKMNLLESPAAEIKRDAADRA